MSELNLHGESNFLAQKLVPELELIWESPPFARAEIPYVADKIARQLESGNEFFCLALFGDLGAGKTTLVAGILAALGLTPEVPVSSPTYTYCSEYSISGREYAHLDLYRLPAIEGNVYQLGITSDRGFRGLFVEWPDRDPELLSSISHVVALDFSNDLEKRIVRFYRRSRPRN